MILLFLSLKQFAIVAAGFLMIGISICACLAFLYWLIKIIESNYPDKPSSTTDDSTIAPSVEVDKPPREEKVRPKKKSIEPSVPDDIPLFGGPPKIETNFGPGTLGKEIKE